MRRNVLVGLAVGAARDILANVVEEARPVEVVDELGDRFVDAEMPTLNERIVIATKEATTLLFRDVEALLVVEDPVVVEPESCEACWTIVFGSLFELGFLLEDEVVGLEVVDPFVFPFLVVWSGDVGVGVDLYSGRDDDPHECEDVDAFAAVRALRGR